MRVKDIEINIQLCWAEQAFTSTGLSEDANVLPEISILTNAFYNRSCAPGQPLLETKRGELMESTISLTLNFLETGDTGRGWDRYCDAILKFLKIAKFLTGRHLTEFNSRHPVENRIPLQEADRRSRERIWALTLPSDWSTTSQLYCSASPPSCHLIIQERKGKLTMKKVESARQTFYKCSGFFGAVRSHVLLLPGWEGWPWLLVFKMVTMMAERCDRR